MPRITAKEFTVGEKKIYQRFFKTLKLPKKKLKKPLYICLFGKLSSGKSTVVQKMAKKIPLVVVRSDTLRLMLIKHYGLKKRFHKTLVKMIIKSIRWLITKNYSVIVDAGNQILPTIQRHGRLARHFHNPIIWLHIYCPEKVILRRIRSRKNTLRRYLDFEKISNEKIYHKRKYLYEKNKGKIKFFATIDTTKPLNPQINKIIKKL